MLSSLGAVVRATEPKDIGPGRPGIALGLWWALGPWHLLKACFKRFLKSGLKADQTRTVQGRAPGPLFPFPGKGSSFFTHPTST